MDSKAHNNFKFGDEHGISLNWILKAYMGWPLVRLAWYIAKLNT